MTPHTVFPRLSVRAALIALPALLLALGGLSVCSPAAQAAASNDDLSNALPLAVGSTASTDTNGTGLQPDEADLDGCGEVSTSVWYVVNAATTGTDVLQTVGGPATSDTIVSVYTSPVANPTVDDLDLLACDDNSGSGFDAQLAVPVQAGTRYLVQLGDNADSDAPGAAPGPIQLQLTSAAAPSNDAASGARSVTVPSTVDVDTLLATVQPGEDPQSGDCDGITSSVWLTWTSTASGVATVHTQDAGDEPDTVLAAWSGRPTGSGLSGLAPVGCNDDADDSQDPDTMLSSLSFPVSSGTTYYLEVGAEDPEDAGSSQVVIDAPDASRSHASTVALTARHRVKPGHKVAVTAAVTSGGSPASGTVTFTVNGKVMKPVELIGGRARLTLPKQKPGKVKVSVAYAGSATAEPSGASVKIKVTKGKKKHQHHHRHR